MDWNKLIYGTYSQDEILVAVDNAEWQKLRKSLLGVPLATKYFELQQYVKKYNSRAAKIRVTNYVNALKRGGLIK